ncbi:hypothetical protein Btru_068628 [Bulinus truncatus]|nr:hypothetical protein Btru_068628 [Bulinus truncatus]
MQNKKAARVYVFGDSELVDDEEDNVVFEMRARHKKTSSFMPDNKEQPPDYFEKEIVEGETLQAIALKYACQVSEIKRINNLIQDQEFYGLKVIKVPMTRYGILSEKFGNKSMLPTQLRHSASLFDDSSEIYNGHFEESNSKHDLSDPETQIKILRTLSIKDNFSAQDKEAEKFLQKMDEDLKRFKQTSRRPKESLTEVISVLTNKSIHPLQTSKPVKKFSGADCGITWWKTLIAFIALTTLFPLMIYIFYKFKLFPFNH